MINVPFYHGITKKLIIAIGNLFSGIKIERMNSSGVVEQIVDVPVSYGNREKWLQRINEEPTIDKRVMITLPRIGFEFLGFQYDPTRKLNKLTQVRSCGSTGIGQIASAYAPVPYNLNFNVYVMAKTQEDGLQITEQLLAFFSPQYVITVNLIPELGIVQDVPFTLNGVDLNDSFEGPIENRREIVYTLSFTAKTEFLGPIDNSTGVIMHTRVKIDPMYGEIGRQVNTDATGTREEHVIVDSAFDILRPIDPDRPYPI